MGARRTFSSAGAIAAIGLLIGCTAVNPKIIDPVISAIESSKSERVEIDFQSFINGDWDEMGIICAFTTNERVDQGLGFEWTGAPVLDSSDRDFLVFVDDRHVVAWTEVPNRLSFCTYGDSSTDGIRVVVRGDSQMTLVRTVVDDPIGASDEYWLVDPATVEVERESLEGAAIP